LPVLGALPNPCVQKICVGCGSRQFGRFERSLSRYAVRKCWGHVLRSARGMCPAAERNHPRHAAYAQVFQRSNAPANPGDHPSSVVPGKNGVADAHRFVVKSDQRLCDVNFRSLPRGVWRLSNSERPGSFPKTAEFGMFGS